MAPVKKRFTWRLMLITGIALAIIGVAVFIDPLKIYFSMVRYSGIAILLNAVFLLITSLTNKTGPGESKWLLFESVLNFLFGILLVSNPIFSFLLFSFLVGLWILCIGILKMLAAIALRKVVKGWWYILIVGFLSAMAGLLIIEDPFDTAYKIVYFIGAFAILMGALYIIDSIRFRDNEEELNMMF